MARYGLYVIPNQRELQRKADIREFFLGLLCLALLAVATIFGVS